MKVWVWLTYPGSLTHKQLGRVGKMVLCCRFPKKNFLEVVFTHRRNLNLVSTSHHGTHSQGIDKRLSSSLGDSLP